MTPPHSSGQGKGRSAEAAPFSAVRFGLSRDVRHVKLERSTSPHAPPQHDGGYSDRDRIDGLGGPDSPRNKPAPGSLGAGAGAPAAFVNCADHGLLPAMIVRTARCAAALT